MLVQIFCLRLFTIYIAFLYVVVCCQMMSTHKKDAIPYIYICVTEESMAITFLYIILGELIEYPSLLHKDQIDYARKDFYKGVKIIGHILMRNIFQENPFGQLKEVYFNNACIIP